MLEGLRLDQADLTWDLAAWLAVASAAGGIARFLVSDLIAGLLGERFPWGTLVVNATGALAAGVVAAAADAGLLADWRLAMFAAVTGFLGSYTTVSSFSLQTWDLVRGGEPSRAAGNVLLSLLLCLSAVALGFTGMAAMLAAAP